MAMARSTMLLYAASLACCLFLSMGSASAHRKHDRRIVPIIHIVGGRFGWDLPVGNLTFYQDWTRNRVFGVGDTLEFPYRTGGTLVQVDRATYDTCRIHNVFHRFFSGPSRFTLRSPGDYYFISSLGRHCAMGQKLHVLAEAGKQGTGGVRFNFRFRGRRQGGRALLAEAPVPVYPLTPSEAPSASASANAPGPAAADTSAAVSAMKNVGIASAGLVIAVLSSLFI